MYLELDEGYPGHRKTLRLCSLLKCDTADAYPPRLWAWAARSAPDGDLSGMEPREIELAVRFRRLDGSLFAALCAAGFIDEDPDGGFRIHNWESRTGGALARMEEKAEAARKRKRLWRERQQNTDVTRSSGVPERAGNADRTDQDKTSQGQSRQDQASEREESAEPARPASPPVLVFPCSGTPRSWNLTAEQIATWSNLYPAVDVLAECRKALGWTEANLSRKKTARGTPAFLARWLGKAQDRGGASPVLGIGGGPRGAPPSRSDGNVETLGNWLEKGAATG